MRRNADSYQHITPELVGNRMRVVVSELSGRGNVLSKAEELGLDVDGGDDVEALEADQGSRGARAVVRERRGLGRADDPAPAPRATCRCSRCSTIRSPSASATGSETYAEAVVKVQVGEQVLHTAAEGNGPVSALDAALRKALTPVYPDVKRIQLADYKVRILDGSTAPRATTRVLDRQPRRDALLEHRRRLVEHHRGVAARAGRRHRVRPAPARRSAAPTERGRGVERLDIAHAHARMEAR